MDLRMALEYDIEQEKQFDYRGLSMGEVVEHIAKFISGIDAVVLADDGEKSAVCVFVVVLFAVDSGKSLAIVFHYCRRIVATIDHI